MEMRKGWDRNLSSFKLNRCMYCHDMFAELADISYGDAWIPEVIDSDPVGTNLIVIRSSIGEDVFAQMNASEKIWSASIEKQRVLESQKNFEWKKISISGRIKLAQMLDNKVPDYGKTVFPAPTLISLRDAAVQHFQMKLSSRKTMWWLLRLINLIIDVADFLNLFHIPPSKKEMSGQS